MTAPLAQAAAVHRVLEARDVVGTSIPVVDR